MDVKPENIEAEMLVEGVSNRSNTCYGAKVVGFNAMDSSVISTIVDGLKGIFKLVCIATSKMR